MSHCLVTGGAGFIGSHLVEALVAQGHGVTVLDNLSTGRLKNLKSVQGKITFIQGDICYTRVVRRAMQSVELVFHLAAATSVEQSINDPVSCTHINITGTLNLLEAAKKNGIQRFVFASSSAVYGNQGKMACHEKLDPRPQSPYAITKLTGEHYCQIYSELHAVPTVALRYFNVYGPRQRPDGAYATVIPLFIRAAQQGDRVQIDGDGTQRRDFVNVRDVVAANMFAAQMPASRFATYNVASGSSITINQLFAYIARLVGVNKKPLYGPARVGDIKVSRADITKIQTMGFCSTVTLRTGLQSMIEQS